MDAVLRAAVDFFVLVMPPLKRRFPQLNKLMDDLPLVILEHGKPLRERMNQFKYAVLERSGGISIIPTEEAA